MGKIFIIDGFTTDIITNSSSELFTGIEHTEAAVVEVLKEIFAEYNANRTRFYTWGDKKGEKYEAPVANMPNCLRVGTFETPDNENFKYFINYLPETWDDIDIDNFKTPDGKIDWESYQNRRNEKEAWLTNKYWPSLKGTVYIASTDDNSIPYEIMQRIGETFDCNRQHLG